MNDRAFILKEDKAEEFLSKRKQNKSLVKDSQEPCEDCVSREAVIKAIDKHTFDTDDGLCLDEDITIILEEISSVTPTRKNGKWEYDADKDKSGGHCNRCGHYLRYGEKTNFCSDCGAEMESEK